MSASDRDPLVGERLNYFESHSFDGGAISCPGSASVLAGLQTAVLPRSYYFPLFGGQRT